MSWTSQYSLENENGQRFDLTVPSPVYLVNVQGLGVSTKRSFGNLGNGFFLLTEDEVPSNPITGDLIYKESSFENYQQLADFIAQAKILYFCYAPLDEEYRCRVRLNYINKDRRDSAGSMRAAISFHPLTPWYQPEAAEVSIDTGGPDSKAYLYHSGSSTKTASGAIASFSDGANAPVVDLTVSIEPVQSGSGDPSPDNVRPISGWTGAKVTRTGKNLLQNVNGNVVTTNGVTFTKRDDGSVALSGTATANAFYNVDFVAAAAVSDAPFDLTAFRGKVIVASLLENAVSGISLTVSYFKQDGTYATLLTTVNADSGTVPADAWKDRTYIKVNAGTNTNGVILYPQLEFGSIATSYEPYNADTYSITFPSEAGTVYGGTLDVTTGKLTVDRAMVDLGTVNWYTSTAAGYTRFWARITDIKRISSSNVLASMLCSAYKTETANNTYSGRQGISLQQNDNTVYVYDAQRESMTTADFKTAMSGVQMVYELATPIEYTLTPTEVRTLLGANNIWADTGDSTVEYQAGTNYYYTYNDALAYGPEVSGDLTKRIYPAGHEPSGLLIRYTGAIENPVISLVGTSGRVYGECHINETFAAGETIELCTAPDNSYVHKISAGVVTDLMAASKVDLAFEPYPRAPVDEACVLTIDGDNPVSGAAELTVYRYYRSV